MKEHNILTLNLISAYNFIKEIEPLLLNKNIYKAESFGKPP